MMLNRQGLPGSLGFTPITSTCAHNEESERNILILRLSSTLLTATAMHTHHYDMLVSAHSTVNHSARILPASCEMARSGARWSVDCGGMKHTLKAR